ncbi:unnamed protein product [Rhizopus stolonifer]
MVPPQRCRNMLKEGKWETNEYKQWRSLCETKKYKGKYLHGCLRNKSIIYVGDSIMREQYYAMIQLFRPGRPSQEAIHQDQKVFIKKHNVTIEMWWDPFLNSNRTLQMLQGNAQERPALLILDTGIWYMKDFGNRYLQEWKVTADRVFDGVKKHTIADKVLLSPVEAVEYDLLSPSRKKTMTYDKITLMNNYLRERESTLEDSATPLAVPFVWNQMAASTQNQTLDGLHFKPPVTNAQAQIALNYLCNDSEIPSGIDQTYDYYLSGYPAAILASSLCLIGLVIITLFTYRNKLLDTLYAIKPQLKL